MAELAIAEALKIEEQEGPNREAERQKKQTDDLETARQKNRKIFRPQCMPGGRQELLVQVLRFG